MWVLLGRRQSSALAHLENRELVIRTDGGKGDVPTLLGIALRKAFFL